jgi:hypothetical protein
LYHESGQLEQEKFPVWTVTLRLIFRTSKDQPEGHGVVNVKRASVQAQSQEVLDESGQLLDSKAIRQPTEFPHKPVDNNLSHKIISVSVKS